MTVQIAEKIYRNTYVQFITHTHKRNMSFSYDDDDDDDDAFEEHLSDAQETVRETEWGDCRAWHMDYMCAL